MHRILSFARVRRTLALAFVTLALGIAIASLVMGARCGVRSVSESCFSPEECEAKSECRSRIHPLSLVFAAGSVAGLVFAWRGWRTALFGLAVGAGALGALFGFSFGIMGPLVALGLLAGGLALPARDRAGRLVAGAAIAASLLPFVLLVAMLSVVSPSAWLVYPVIFLPGLAWMAVALLN